MGSFLSAFNRLLPFATPGTPLIQDLAHLAAICGLLYFAPQFQQWMQDRRLQPGVLYDEREGAEQEGPRDAAPVLNEDAADTDDENANEDAGHDVPGAADGQFVDHAQPAEEAAAANDDPQPGPAHGPRVPAPRSVGAKKAKSLARRDHRRAYHEFQRAQGDAQRAREAEGAAEREAALAAERERRKAAEAALEAKKAKEREQKREQERREREEEIRRRELVMRIVREQLEIARMCHLSNVAKDVGEDVDEEWVEKILKASGMIGRKDNVMTMITTSGWVVRVCAEDMARVYEAVTEHDRGKSDSRIEYDTLGAKLEGDLKQRARVAM